MATKSTIVAFVLCMLLVGFLWAGGQTEQGATTDTVELDFMCRGGPENQRMYQAWIEDFSQKNPDIKINYFPFPEGGWEKVRATFAGETAADIVRINDDDVYDLARLEKLVALDPYIDKHLDRDNFFAATFEALSVDGTTYSANLGLGPNVFHYNTDMVANAGLSAPGSWDSTWEWNEFKAALSKLTVDSDADGRPEVYGAGWSESMLTPFLYTNGTNPLPRGVEEADFVQPELIEIFQEVSDLSALHHWATPAEEIDNRTLLFNSKKLAMTWTTEEDAPQFNPDLNWDVMPMPKAREEAMTVSFVRSFGIPVWSENKEAAFRFYAYVWSDAGQKIMIDHGFGVPVTRSAAEKYFNPQPVPEHRAVYTDALDHDAPLKKDALGAVWKKYAAHELGQELMNGNVDAREFLEFIQDAMEARIKEIERAN